jgi:[ribosomal protein S18]-alanine N-acetyltransferase
VTTVEAIKAGEHEPLKALSTLSGVRIDLDAEITRRYTRIWAARDATGAPLAYLVAWLIADELQIVDLATVVRARRRGLGRALLNHLLQFGRSEGYAWVLLEVRASNEPAIRLYRSMGFEPRRVRAAYYSDGEDALEMGVML